MIRSALALPTDPSVSDQPDPTPQQRYALALPLFGAFAVLLVFGAALAWQLGLFSVQRDWVIAGGQEGGTYQLLAEQLSRHLASVESNDRLAVRATDGSAMNLALLNDGEVQFALGQGDGPMPPTVRLLAAVYAEWVHVLQALPPSSQAPPTVDGLASATSLWLGASGSGTRYTAQRVLAHVGVPIDPARVVEAPLAELAQRFASGEVTAAVVLAPPGAAVVREILASGEVRLVPVAGAALSLLDAAYQPVEIPVHLYGSSPEASVATVAVDAMILAHRDVQADAVRSILQEIAEARAELSDAVGFRLPLARYAPERVSLPYHAGATAFFLREEPSWFVRNAEAISLTLTLVVGAWSVGSLLLRWSASRRKERIDAFYWRVRECGKLPRHARLAALEEIEREAMQQLMDEQLSADQAFLIFQNYLRNMIEEAKPDSGNSS
ncbi:MAG: TAXI family TRAP transporter solute-binding subunit [Pseudomonadota bacterium]